MKKLLGLAVVALSFASCTQDDLLNYDNESGKQEQLKSEMVAVFENGASISVNQNSYGVAPRRAAAGKQGTVTDFTNLGAAAPLQSGLASKLTNEVFMQDFPNGKDNMAAKHDNLQDLSYDFLYVSNGLPFEVYTLYSHALYIDHVGIYWIDEKGGMHEQDFWSMADNGWLAKGVNTKDPTQAAEDVDTFNQTGEGFKFQLPKGWKFGFYVWNAQNGKKYSESTLNETTVTTGSGKYKKTETVKGDKQVVTYAYEGINLIGFEDIFRSNNSDKDYNDIVLYINPQQTVIPTGQVVVRWVDENGVNLLQPEYSGEMAVGATYTGNAKEIPDYELVDPNHTTETKTINEYDRDNVITFVYRQKPVAYTINHICNDGCQTLKTTTGTGKIGEVVYADPEVFSGHVAVSASQEMTLQKGENVINLYYKHCETAYTVYYLEQGTDQPLADPTQEGSRKMGESVTVYPKNIAGYTVVEYTDNTFVLNEDASKNVYIFYYTKDIVEPDPTPTPEGDIVITLGRLTEELICESDDFCIKFNGYEQEYAYIDHSASNLKGLRLAQGENMNIVIGNINNWTNGSKIYWQDLMNGMERAVFDLRLYGITSVNSLADLLKVEGIIAPEGYVVSLDFSEESHYENGTQELHISVLVDRPKK